MKKIFKVKNARKSVHNIFLNGLMQEEEKDYILRENSIKFSLGINKGEKIHYTKEFIIDV